MTFSRQQFGLFFQKCRQWWLCPLEGCHSLTSCFVQFCCIFSQFIFCQLSFLWKPSTMLVATFFHQLFERSEVEILHLQKIVSDQPYINKEKQYRECGHRGFLVEKNWPFLSGTFSYVLTNDKTILQKRMLTKSEEMTGSVSDYFKKNTWTSFSVLWDAMWSALFLSKSSFLKKNNVRLFSFILHQN